MLGPGALIWVSFRPLLRLILTTSAGFVLTKAELFPGTAARGCGQIIVNVTIPCLMMAKIIPAFSEDNIADIGPLLFVAIVYKALGILFAWIIRQYFWVPHRFRHGILVAGGWSNWGDIPNAVVMSVCASAPFGPGDSDLSVAYVAVFILVFSVTLFPLGGHKWVARDFVGPDVEPEEIREAVRNRRQLVFSGWSHPMAKIRHLTLRLRRKPLMHLPGNDVEDQPNEKTEGGESSSDKLDGSVSFTPRPLVAGRHVSFYPDDATTVVPTEGVQSPFPSRAPSPNHQERLSSYVTPSPPSRWTQYKSAAKEFFFSLLSPPSLSIIIAFPIALIPPVKALFVSGVPGTSIPSAPDGQQPLAFLIDTFSFIGAASVPLGLVCLGAALARLSVPRSQWGTLPLGAIFSLAVAKTLIMPVLGILICEGMVNANIIDRENKVLRFVCMFFSCLPTATTQVFITQVASSTGSAEHLSPFLIPQYFLMCFSMVGVIVYSLQLLF